MKKYIEGYEKMNVIQLARLQKKFAKLYWSTNLIGLGSDQVQIHEDGMEEIAPLEEWTLNIDRQDESYPFLHEITRQGVRFIAITEEPIYIYTLEANIDERLP